MARATNTRQIKPTNRNPAGTVSPIPDATVSVRNSEQLFGTLSRLRDMILVLVTATYGVGFICFAFAAQRYDFGFFRAFDAQYLVAGALPVAIYFFFWFLISKIEFNMGDSATESVFVLMIIMSQILLGVFAEKVDLVPSMMIYFTLVTGAAVCVSMIKRARKLEFSKAQNLREKISYRALYFLSRLALVFCLCYPIYYYGNSTYPIVPQEFGGLRPKCARLSLEISKLPKDFIDPSNFVSADTSQYRSVLVEVILISSDRMIVRFPKSDLRTKTYEIKPSIVTAIAWC